ncbi:MAG: aldehyde-activating protein [Ramlibacter sp.]|nr:aldehyde-activating protein [Ramlibacter sp.]
MHVTGSCHCGQVTYEAEVDPARVSICNCTDCQVLSGSAYRVTVSAPAETFKLLTGRPKVYVKTADSGNRRRHAFCPNCGTPVSACADSDSPPNYGLRVGCLAQKAQLPPQRRIWCGSALEWAQDVSSLPGTERG